jgi:hypothetical protein
MRNLGITLAVLVGLTASAAADPEVGAPRMRTDNPPISIDAELPLRLRGTQQTRLVTDVQTFYDSGSYDGTKHTIATTGIRRIFAKRYWVQATGGLARTSYRFDRGIPCSGAVPAFMAGVGATLGKDIELGLRAWSGIDIADEARIHVVAVAFEMPL